MLSPEFAALFLGLALYTAAFISEIVRAGILAVDRGQVRGGCIRSAIGEAQLMCFIILPQALRVIVPPLTSQYLNCTKNSSLAVAIGYPDLVSIANTTINQTGQAIEGIAIIMLVYLTISLAISGFMNWYNRRIRAAGSQAMNRNGDRRRARRHCSMAARQVVFQLAEFDGDPRDSLSCLEGRAGTDRLGAGPRRLVAA